MTAPGSLNRRLVLEAPRESADGAGGVTRLYDVVTTLWARVEPISARPDVTAGSLGAELRYRIVIRKRSDVTTAHRLLDGARTYHILSARESRRLKTHVIEIGLDSDNGVIHLPIAAKLDAVPIPRRRSVTTAST